jgi:hypothetical protein
LLNCRKHLSELSRAIAVTAKIEADDDPHRKFIADGFEERLKAGKKVVQSTEIGDEDSQIVGHGRLFNHPAGAVRPYCITQRRPAVGSAAWAPLLGAAVS